jgi:hypothetical protein
LGSNVSIFTSEFGVIRRFVAADYTMEGLKEKSQRPHRSPNATPEDISRKTEEIRRMESSAGHTVSGGEAVRQGGRGKPQPWWAVTAALRAMERFMACYGIPELLRFAQ